MTPVIYVFWGGRFVETLIWMFHPLSQMLLRKSRSMWVFMVDIHMWIAGFPTPLFSSAIMQRLGGVEGHKVPWSLAEHNQRRPHPTWMCVCTCVCAHVQGLRYRLKWCGIDTHFSVVWCSGPCAAQENVLTCVFVVVEGSLSICGGLLDLCVSEVCLWEALHHCTLDLCCGYAIKPFVFTQAQLGR